VLCEVLDQDIRVFTDVPKIHALASSLQKQQSIEILEKRRVWLVNGAQNSLASSSKFPKEAYDIESAL
jgi:hypothetical protein